MPYSEIAYHDIGLSNFREERETPEDRVEYEDHRLETVRLHSRLEACSEKPFKTEVQKVQKRHLHRQNQYQDQRYCSFTHTWKESRNILALVVEPRRSRSSKTQR